MKRQAPRRSEAGRILVPLLAGVLALLLAAAALPAGEETPNAGLTSVGKGVFKSYCASCHGVEAKGDGPIAEYFRVPPTDLTLIAQENEGDFPFDEVVKLIDGREPLRAHGSDMPVWGDVFQNVEGGGEEEAVRQKIKSLTHFLWSIQTEEEES